VAGRLSPLQEFAGVPRELQRPVEAGDQFLTTDRLLDEIDRARLHRLHRDGHVAVAGDHDRRQMTPFGAQLAQQLQPDMPGR